MKTITRLRTLDYWHFLACGVFIPALLTLANIVPEKKESGGVDTASKFSGYVVASSGVAEIYKVVGWREEVVFTNQSPSFPPRPSLPVVKHFPLSPDEQAALTNLLAHARAGKATAARTLADFEFKLTHKSETVSVWCYYDDIIEFRVFDYSSGEFKSPTTSLRCPGISLFIQSVLRSERSVDIKSIQK